MWKHGRRQRHLGFDFAHASQCISVTDIVKGKPCALRASVADLPASARICIAYAT